MESRVIQTMYDKINDIVCILYLHYSGSYPSSKYRLLTSLDLPEFTKPTTSTAVYALIGVVLIAVLLNHSPCRATQWTVGHPFWRKLIIIYSLVSYASSFALQMVEMGSYGTQASWEADWIDQQVGVPRNSWCVRCCMLHFTSFLGQ